MALMMSSILVNRNDVKMLGEAIECLQHMSNQYPTDARLPELIAEISLFYRQAQSALGMSNV